MVIKVIFVNRKNTKRENEITESARYKLRTHGVEKIRRNVA